MKKKAIITGGLGFIGSHLAESLIKKNFFVTIIDNFSTGRIENIEKFSQKKIKIVNSDIKDKKIFKYFRKVDVVFHLAALADIVPSINYPESYFNTNVHGTLNILNASKDNKVKKLIYAASASCYGVPKKYPTDENCPIDPKYPYALTKRLGEELVLHWGKIYKLNVTSLRLFNVYGTKSRTSGVYGAMFGTFLAQKLKNYPFTVVGDGKQSRDFTYVSDVVDAFMKCINYNKSGEIFNVASGNATSVNRICDLLGGKKIFIQKRPGEPDKTLADITKINKELGWKPKISIEKGVKKVLEDINYWKKAPLWTKKKIDIATRQWFKFLS